ncbi:MAG: NAD(+)/NADH kinase [Bacillota bacterium]|jgi:NAD+ kinase|nr:NAD(+)/NADH kinase [Candidatus Fermentithermobacillaceae bacterium]
MTGKTKSLIGVYPNLHKEGSRELSARLLDWLEVQGYRGCFPPCLSVLVGRAGHDLPLKLWPERVKFAVVLGGDGTLLAAGRALGCRGIPLLGVNLGHFGFLTELESEELFSTLPSFLTGRHQEDKRIFLRASVLRGGQVIRTGLAMNEACVVKGPYGRMTITTLRVGGNIVDTYSADGLIIATPTGSTAYSLSAGGPIMEPSIEALLVTPVCAHTLYSRSIVLPARESCEIEVVEPSQSTSLSLDGQEFFALEKGDIVRVAVAGPKVTLLRREGWSFYNVLRRKLKEGADRLPR